MTTDTILPATARTAAPRSRPAKTVFRAALLTGSALALAGCVNLDFLFGTQEEPVAEMGPKAEFSCYREARYLDLTPEQCVKVGGLPVGHDKTAIAETAPDAAPRNPMVIEPLPPLN